MHFITCQSEEMGFRKLASGALIAGLLAAGSLLTGCSSKPLVVGSPTIQTYPPTTAPSETTGTTPALTVASTSEVPVTEVSTIDTTLAPGTTVQTTLLAPPDVIGPAPDDLEALFAATIRSDEVQYGELFVPASQRSRARLLTALAPAWADAVLKTYAAIDAKNRRYEQGAIDQRVALRMENYSLDARTAEVIICRHNNGSEFDSKGTVSTTDDTLIQDDLETTGWRVQMTKTDNGTWKRSKVDRESTEKCLNVFS
jgi:hypothetical protein